MTPFIDRIIDDLLESVGDDWRDVLFVLPSRRAGVILKRRLALRLERAMIAPEVMTLDQFVDELSDQRTLSSIDLILEFYQYYCSITKEPEPFETFMDWAQMFLSDMNDIDSYLVPSESLFSNINDAKRMEAWSVDGQGLTPTQEQYLEFFGKLSTYYEGFKKYLESKGMGYSGMVFRKAVQALPDKLDDHRLVAAKRKIVFAGFNALKTSEWKLFTAFQFLSKTHFYWDDDAYFHHVRGHEAGEFMRRWKRDWPGDRFDWTDDAFRESAKRVEVISSPGALTQVRFLSEKLASLSPEEWSRSVVVLGDESLLIPLLESLPDDERKVNVTIGYSLKNSVVHSFIRAFLKLHLTALNWQSKRGSYRFYHQDILAVTRHPIFVQADRDGRIQERVDRLLFRYQRTFVDGAELANDDPAFAAVFSSQCSSPVGFLRALIDFLEKLPAETYANVLSRELVLGALKMLRRVDDLIEDYHLDISLNGLNKLMKTEMGSYQVPFRGEPVQGLQIMGLLESRMLDFDRVFMLSVNEGKIPADSSSNSLIPNDFRFEFKLPTYKDKDALFAYYFYRLLKRSAAVTLFYSTQSEDFSNLEASRYISQLRTELVAYNRQHRFVELHSALNPGLEYVREGAVEKSEELMSLLVERLEDRGISPSALNVYLESPLEYYLRYVLRIDERQEVEEEIEDSTYGDIVHDVLEQGYLDIQGRLTEHDVKKALKTMPERLEKTFDEKFKGGRQTGSNRFKFEMARYQLERFYDIELREVGKKEISLLALEERLEGVLTVNDIKVKLVGKADRIEEEKGVVRIVDYKSGTVSRSDLSIVNIEDLRGDKRKPKAFQLLLYAWLYMQNYPAAKEIEVANISLNKLGDWHLPVSINKEKVIRREQVNEFEEILKEIIAEILNPNLDFANSEEVRYPLFK